MLHRLLYFLNRKQVVVLGVSYNRIPKALCSIMARVPLHLGEEAIGGLSAGVIGTIIGFPLDVVKTRMQTSQSSSSPGGIISMGSKIVRQEGIFALYKGLGPPLISLSILNTINFTSYSLFRQRVFQGEKGFDLRNGLAGMACGPIASSVSTVENLVKVSKLANENDFNKHLRLLTFVCLNQTQMQMDVQHRFSGSWNCVLALVQSRGVGVLYTGHGINTVRESVFLFSYFFVYEGLREWIIRYSGQDVKLAVPVAGGFSGACSWFVSFPLDCVRAGVQGGNIIDHGERLSATNLFIRLMRTKGVKGLYSGVVPSIVRAFLVSGSRFSAYEGALWLLRGGRNNLEV